MQTALEASIMTRSAKTTRRSCMREVINSTIRKDKFIKSHIDFAKNDESPVKMYRDIYAVFITAKSTAVNIARINCPYLPFLLTIIMYYKKCRIYLKRIYAAFYYINVW